MAAVVPFLSGAAQSVGSIGHGTVGVVIVEPGTVMATVDSKEVYTRYIDDGTAETTSSDQCKLTPVGSAIAITAGLVRANDYNVLDNIRSEYKPGEQLHDLATRLKTDLPKSLGPVLQAVLGVSDYNFQQMLATHDALEVALVGVENGKPGVDALGFRAQFDQSGNITFDTHEFRCPEDCPDGHGAAYLGTHEDIDAAVAANRSLMARATAQAVTALARIEYSSRPDVIGGAQSLVRADANGVTLLQAGACGSPSTTPVPTLLTHRDEGTSDASLELHLDAENSKYGSDTGDAERTIAGLAVHSEPVAPVAPIATLDPIAPFRAELDRRLSATTNLVCHQNVLRSATARGLVHRDSIDASVRVVDNHELYSDIHAGGREYKQISDVGGSWSSGDLTTILKVTRIILDNGSARMLSRVGDEGDEEVGLKFRSSKQAALWQLFEGATPYAMAFEGTIWLSKSSGTLRQIEWHTTESIQPSSKNILQISWTVNFSTVQISGESFVAPTTSSYAVKYRANTGREDLTQSTFSDFQRFGSDARLILM